MCTNVRAILYVLCGSSRCVKAQSSIRESISTYAMRYACSESHNQVEIDTHSQRKQADESNKKKRKSRREWHEIEKSRYLAKSRKIAFALPMLHKVSKLSDLAIWDEHVTIYIWLDAFYFVCRFRSESPKVIGLQAMFFYMYFEANRFILTSRVGFSNERIERLKQVKCTSERFV